MQHTIQQLTSRPHRILKPFRYTDLPQEIRSIILEYTDLVSLDAVQWRPQRRIIRSSSCAYCTADEVTNNFECSCHRLPGPSVDSDEWFPCCGNCGPLDNSGICYCTTHCAIWSSSCTCGSPRHALFSVSRQVRQDAILVFYSHNRLLVTPHNSPRIRFVQLDDDRWAPRGCHFMPKVELSLYLSSISRSALQHIRWLEWILPSSQRTYLLPETPAWFDYLDTLLLMKNAMTLPALTFVIDIAASGMCWDISEYRKRLPLDEHAWRWYETIIAPVKCLARMGLKNFFVQLRRCDIEQGQRVHHEQRLEQMVMGPSYVSAKRAKPAESMFELIRRKGQENTPGN